VAHQAAAARDRAISHTYRQSSKASEQALELDPYNRFYARGAKFRLAAEALRDQALAVGGLLSRKRFGPSVMPHQPPGIWQTIYNGAQAGSSRRAKTPIGAAVYTYIKRTSAYPQALNFDATQPRELHDRTHAHQYAAAGAGDAQRSGLRRRGARPRATRHQERRRRHGAPALPLRAGAVPCAERSRAGAAARLLRRGARSTTPVTKRMLAELRTPRVAPLHDALPQDSS
jgi:hypothetical protein